MSRVAFAGLLLALIAGCKPSGITMLDESPDALKIWFNEHANHVRLIAITSPT